MSTPTPPTSAEDPDVAPMEVVVGRSIGGIVLVLVGGAIVLGCVFMVFIAPGMGGDLANWSDLQDLYWIPGGIGLAIAGFGVNMVQRARKRTIEEPVDAAALAAEQGAAMQAAALESAEQPTVLPPRLPPKSIL